MMKKTLYKSIALLLLIPLINSIAFGLGTLFHEMHVTTISPHQFDNYRSAMILMIGVLAITIGCVEMLYEDAEINHKQANLLYIMVLFLIGVSTYDQFTFRPFEHTLTYISCFSVLINRRIWDLIPSKIPRFNWH